VKRQSISANEFGKTTNMIIETLIGYMNLPNEKGIGQGGTCILPNAKWARMVIHHKIVLKNQAP
jgi:hypothetical protein